MVTPVLFQRDLLAQRGGRVRDDALFLHGWAQREMESRLELIHREFTAVRRLDIPADEILNIEVGAHDLVTSVLDLQHANDLPGLLIQAKRGLKADGLFLAAMFGGETLFELRQSLMQVELEIKGGVSPRVHPFATKQDMGALMQRAGFALPVIDSEIVSVTYDNIFKLITDLRGMGQTNILAERNKSYVGRDFFMRVAEYYQEHFADADGRIVATFEILFIHGWAPHKSQQKPLRPGSAENRLADVLGAVEVKTADEHR